MSRRERGQGPYESDPARGRRSFTTSSRDSSRDSSKGHSGSGNAPRRTNRAGGRDSLGQGRPGLIRDPAQLSLPDRDGRHDAGERDRRGDRRGQRRVWRDWTDAPEGIPTRDDDRSWRAEPSERAGGWDDETDGPRDWDEASTEWDAVPGADDDWGDNWASGREYSGFGAGGRIGAAGTADSGAKVPQPKYYRPLLIALCVVLLLNSVLWIFNGVGYFTLIRRDLALVKSASAELQLAGSTITANPLSPTGIGQARAHMVNAYVDFSQLQSDLRQYPAIAGLTPHYGKLLRAAAHVMPLAIEASRAGVIGCDVLALVASRLHDPLNPAATGLSADDMKAINQDIGQVQVILNRAAAQIGQLTPSDTAADPRIAKAVDLFRTDFPKIQSMLQVFGGASALLGVGQPANYLLEVLDSSELRPGGGFIGNYGFLTITGGRLTRLKVEDVTLQEQACPLYASLPFSVDWYPTLQQYIIQDSNYEPDFPASAVNMEKAYAFCGGTTPITGVVAITPWWFKNALAITGNIPVPEFNVTVTPQNLVDTIHYYQLGTQTLGSCPSYDPACRKHFTGVLLSHFFARLHEVISGNMGAFAKLIGNSIRTKDIQIYLNDPKAEAALQTLHIASSVESPAHEDTLMMVDANVTPNKANVFITYTLNDQITLDGTGAATHVATLTYYWPKSAESDNNLYGSGPYGNTGYKDYLRLYVPPNAAIVSHSDTWNLEHADKQFNRLAWGGHFLMGYPSTYTIKVTWKVPGAAVRDSAGWHYALLMQNQPGDLWNVNLQITTPPCATFLDAPVQMKQTGAHTAAVKSQLFNDSTFKVDYSC